MSATEVNKSPYWYEITKQNLLIFTGKQFGDNEAFYNFYLPPKSPILSQSAVYLGKENQCFMQKDTLHTAGLNKEHIVPKSVCNRYHTTLGFLENHPANHVRICRDCHNRVDSNYKSQLTGQWEDGKTTAFYKRGENGGMFGLVQYLAEDYPLSTNVNIAKRQQRQWIDLFAMLYARIPIQMRNQTNDLIQFRRWGYRVLGAEEKKAIKDTQRMERLQFAKAHVFVGQKLVQWREGDFQLAVA